MRTLQERIGYRFKDEALLKLALTHPSVNKKQNNQRLEFIGDAALGAAVAYMLYNLYPDEQEGQLARRHAALVRGETLAQVARELGIGDKLTFGLSEIQAAGHENDSNLEDALEALIGAMFLDGGMQAVQRFIDANWSGMAKQLIAAPKDAKTALQEWAQGRGLPIPAYQVIEASGPAHAPLFTVEVSVEGQPTKQAQGSSKRAAEQEAASQLLEALGHGT